MPKNIFSTDRDYQHGQAEGVGVLVVNLGTPEAPTAKALGAAARHRMRIKITAVIRLMAFPPCCGAQCPGILDSVNNRTTGHAACTGV